MKAPRIAVLMATTGLALAACGSGSDSAPAVTEPAAAEAPATDVADDFTEGDATTQEPADDDAPAEPEAPAADDAAEPAAEASSDPDPAEEPAATEPPVTEPPVEAPAEPVLGGRSLAADVQPAAQFDGNPFPDLVVDDVGKGTQVNTANILPSDRPVLLWAWAPH